MICAQVGCKEVGVHRMVTKETLSRPMGLEETKYYAYYFCNRDYQLLPSERQIKNDVLEYIDFEKLELEKTLTAEIKQHESEKLAKEENAG